LNACRKYTLSKIHQSIRFFTCFVFSFISVGFLLVFYYLSHVESCLATFALAGLI
jgi:hypothetical protein